MEKKGGNDLACSTSQNGAVHGLKIGKALNHINYQLMGFIAFKVRKTFT